MADTEQVDKLVKGHSIELPLTVESRAELLSYFDGLEGKWLENFKPHLSLAVIREEVRDVEPLRAAVQELGREFGPFKIQLSGIGLFPSKRRPVLTLTPAANAELLAAHDLISQRMDKAGISPIPYYRPGMWSPHVTLMMGRPRAETGELAGELSRRRWPGEYQMEIVELIEFHPATRLEVVKLQAFH
ncbi:MAG: 2'-5' RNA ligase family protein [Verrucomicrobiota bacterium]